MIVSNVVLNVVPVEYSPTPNIWLYGLRLFIDILIVSILTTVWLETLMRDICQLQRLSDPIAYL